MNLLILEKATNLNDGKSIENAIKVNSVAEEYEFVEKIVLIAN